jgi:hypothetical protein
MCFGSSLLQRLFVDVKAVGVLHDELTRAQNAALGPRLVAFLGLEVVPQLRQLLVVELSLLALAEEIMRLTGSTSEIVYEALPIDDPKIRCPDITKAMHLLDWHPQIDLHEGLRRVWEYELSTQSHSVTGLAGDVLEKLLRAQPAGGGDTAP